MAHEPRGWTPMGGQQLFQPPPLHPPPLSMGAGAGMGALPALRLLSPPPSLFGGLSSSELNGRQMTASSALDAAGMLLGTRSGARGMDSDVASTGHAIQPGMAIVPAQYRQQQYMNDPTLSPFRQQQQSQPLRANNKRQRPVNSDEGATWYGNQVQEPQRLYEPLQTQQLQEQAHFRTQQQQTRYDAQVQQQQQLQRKLQQQQQQQNTQREQLQQLQVQREQQRQEFQRRQQQQQFPIQQQQGLQTLQQQLQLQRHQQELQKEQQRQQQLQRQQQERQSQQLRILQQQQDQLQRHQQQQRQLAMDQEQEQRIRAHFGSSIWSNEQHQSRAASSIHPHFQSQPIQTQQFRSFPSLTESESPPQSLGNAGMFQSSYDQQPQQRIPQRPQSQSFAPMADHPMIQQQQKRSPMSTPYEVNFQQNGLVFNGNQSVTNQASPNMSANHLAPQEMQWSTNEAEVPPVSFASSSAAESRLTGSFRIDELLSAASAMDDPLSPSYYYSANGRANQEARATDTPPCPHLNTAMQFSSFSTSPTWRNPHNGNLPNAEIMHRNTIPGVLQASVAINRLQEQRKTPQEETTTKAKPKPRPRTVKKSSPAEPPIPSSPDWVVPAGPGGYFPFVNVSQNQQTVATPTKDRMRIDSLLKTMGEPAKRKTKAKLRTNKKQPPPAALNECSATTPATNPGLGPFPPPAISPANEQQSVADLSKQAPISAVGSVHQEAPPEEVSRPPTVNPTVMIFCRRDFMRYQAAKLWKKYEEKKKKRDLVSVRTTGKRRRYLNSRNEEQAPVPQKPISQSEPSEKTPKTDDHEFPTPMMNDDAPKDAPTLVSDKPEAPASSPTIGSPLPNVD